MGRDNESGGARAHSLNAHLSEDLVKEYGIRSVRVRTGDVVKVLRGSYRGVEGKVIKVYLDEGRVAVEGLTRQNSRGENSPVRIHASKVLVTRLNLDDKVRREALEAIKSRKTGKIEGKVEGEVNG
ncbi:50S ribosomal protein L24 [Conexivisphaera calida]|uniref:Large ribosomal subunit protein uL24 n=1 Tax=Conexivisphaera calida TaxID=1874277 RepID=A0A4P2VB34_9ARCH|nr:50S ribosomal protein L24 [Conexivisphaera calida]BBE41709.1 LSU ribosomal protein L26e [Conexivisphaera calida]